MSAMISGTHRHGRPGVWSSRDGEAHPICLCIVARNPPVVYVHYLPGTGMYVHTTNWKFQMSELGSVTPWWHADPKPKRIDTSGLLCWMLWTIRSAVKKATKVSRRCKIIMFCFSSSPSLDFLSLISSHASHPCKPRTWCNKMACYLKSNNRLGA